MEAAGISRPASPCPRPRAGERRKIIPVAFGHAGGRGAQKVVPGFSGARDLSAEAEARPPKLRRSAGGNREEDFGTQRRRDAETQRRHVGASRRRARSIRTRRDCKAPEADSPIQICSWSTQPGPPRFSTYPVRKMTKMSAAKRTIIQRADKFSEASNFGSCASTSTSLRSLTSA